MTSGEWPKRARRRDNDLRRRTARTDGAFDATDGRDLTPAALAAHIRRDPALSDLTELALANLHLELGARMVPFAGYNMPVQYPMGVMGEHQHTRTRAGLFDVSHMGQVLLHPKGSIEDTARAFEALMPVDVLGLAEGRQRYGLLTNDAGGILDDLMFANRGDHFYVVVNAGCKADDIAHMQAHLSATCDVVPVTDRALLALQGPAAEAALSAIVDVSGMRFMDSVNMASTYGDLWISRSGYTGEDGFEISVANTQAEAFARALLSAEDVAPIGLGARDALRLEAGLCLYGHDITQETSPIEAGLTWAIQKARRSGGDRAGGFPGAKRILQELTQGPARKRVGLRPEGRAPMREGTALFAGDTPIGTVTSGGFGPTVGAPIAMGYVDAAYAEPNTQITGEVRGKRLPLTVSPMPFIQQTYKR